MFGYDGSGYTSALGGRADSKRVDAGQLVRRTGALSFLQRRAGADATGVVYFG